MEEMLITKPEKSSISRYTFLARNNYSLPLLQSSVLHWDNR